MWHVACNPAAVLHVLVHLAAELLAPSRCAACDAPAPLGTAFCAPCARTLVASVRGLAAFEYGGALARAIARMKYEDRPDLARPLAAALARLAARLPDVDAVVPVPLHPKRRAERGFNQATLLAAPLARRLRVPCETRALARARDTPRQAELDGAARRRNVEGAFAADARRVRGRRWLLVDDVRTTGATLEACASALVAAGAASVTPVSLAAAI